MTERTVRAHVLGLPTRTTDGNRELLVERYTSGDEPFCCPIGGGVEFGEYSATAVTREFREETGYAATPTEFLGVSENVYRFAGAPGHEVSLVWAVAFGADEPYERERIRVEESDDERRWATWQGFAELREGPEPLYPEGVLELLGGTDRIESN